MRFKLEKVHYMPKQLEPGILYVSYEFGTAAHLCACGCGEKVRTPLGPTEWAIEEHVAGPSLWPSVGNWQRPCKSHYVITAGEIMWAPRWSKTQIYAGRANEERRRQAYFAAQQRERKGPLSRFADWVRTLVKWTGQKITSHFHRS